MLKNSRMLASHGRNVVEKFSYDVNLCDLFYDDLIGRYESTQPIPTYLACKLTKWALRQMNKRYEENEGGTKTLVWHQIPTKYEGVQRILWYL